MPNHRMFSFRIANSAKFLQMPVEAQLLYFHFVVRADDDGIVEAYPIMRLLGIAPDNFKILVAKNFIEILNEDQVIVIMDWLEHNTIRADRKVNSIYIDLLRNKCPEMMLIDPKPRSDVQDNSKRVCGLSTDGISKDKISKDKISKDKIERVYFTPPSLLEVSNYCQERKNSINPQNFVDFYESKGWLVGKNKMKDWRASVRTWENRGKSTNYNNQFKKQNYGNNQPDQQSSKYAGIVKKAT